MKTEINLTIDSFVFNGETLPRGECSLPCGIAQTIEANGWGKIINGPSAGSVLEVATPETPEAPEAPEAPAPEPTPEPEAEETPKEKRARIIAEIEAATGKPFESKASTANLEKKLAKLTNTET